MVNTSGILILSHVYIFVTFNTIILNRGYAYSVSSVHICILHLTKYFLSCIVYSITIELLINHNPFTINIIVGRINGRKSRGRPRNTFIGEMIGMDGCKVDSRVKPLALKREQ